MQIKRGNKRAGTLPWGWIHQLFEVLFSPCALVVKVSYPDERIEQRLKRLEIRSPSSTPQELLQINESKLKKIEFKNKYAVSRAPVIGLTPLRAILKIILIQSNHALGIFKSVVQYKAYALRAWNPLVKGLYPTTNPPDFCNSSTVTVLVCYCIFFIFYLFMQP